MLIKLHMFIVSSFILFIQNSFCTYLTGNTGLVNFNSHPHPPFEAHAPESPLMAPLPFSNYQVQKQKFLQALPPPQIAPSPHSNQVEASYQKPLSGNVKSILIASICLFVGFLYVSAIIYFLKPEDPLLPKPR